MTTEEVAAKRKLREAKSDTQSAHAAPDLDAKLLEGAAASLSIHADADMYLAVHGVCNFTIVRRIVIQACKIITVVWICPPLIMKLS